MSNRKSKKAVAIGLSLSMMANASPPINAVDLVAIPQNIQNAFPPTFTNPLQPISNDFSINSIEEKINNVLNPVEKEESNQAELLDDSGSCGTGVTYTFTASTGELTISGSGAMTDNKPRWYEYKNAIKSVKIETGVTSIGNFAFQECNNLTSVTIPAGVTSIGSQAFLRCYGLTSVTIPSSVTKIGNSAFGQCFHLTGSLTIPAGVTSIDAHAFNGCSALTELNLPASITSIGDYAFRDCPNLTSATYKGTSDPGVSSSGVFSGCPRLTEVKVPQNYESSNFCGIPAELDECVALGSCGTNVNWELNTCTGELTISGSGLMTDYSSDNKAPWYLYKNSITSVVIESGITLIGNFAFTDCSGLNSVTIPSSVTSIESDAFSGCSGLISITLPNNLNSIGNNAFSGCSGLTELNIPASVTSIGDDAFKDCTSLTSTVLNNDYCVSRFKNVFSNTKINSIVLGDGVTTIGNNAFSGYSGLTEINLPATVTSIGDYAFKDCTGLTEFNIPASIISIGSFVIDGCSKLDKIIVNSSNSNYKSVDGILFSKDGKNLIRCPEGKSGTIALLDSLTLISPYAFSGCLGLTSISLGEGVVKISDYAFKDCTGLTSINIPHSVTEFGSDAFSGCSNLTSATLNNSYVTKNFKTIFPSNYENFKTIILGDDVSSIDDSAFKGCSNLNSITIDDNVVSIGDSAFSDCVELDTVTIPGNVTKIHRSAFSNCKVLNNVTVSGNLEYVGEGAFSECIGLDNFTYKGTTAPRYDTGTSVFYNCPKLKKVNVPNNYEGNDFCGKAITGKKRSIKEWFSDNVAWVAPIFTIMGGIVTVIGFFMKDKVKKFFSSHCACCSCCNRGQEPTSCNAPLIAENNL